MNQHPGWPDWSDPYTKVAVVLFALALWKIADMFVLLARLITP